MVKQHMIREWIEKNPLRVYRNKQTDPITMMGAAVALGVSAMTIRQWEYGAGLPSPNNMAKLEEMVGPHVSADWDSWYSSRPQV